jgi:hypothetical protein
MKTFITARNQKELSDNHLKLLFGGLFNGPSDSFFADSGNSLAAGVCGLPFRAPVMAELSAHPPFSLFLSRLFGQGFNLLIVPGDPGDPRFHTEKEGLVSPLNPDPSIIRLVREVLDGVAGWAGSLEPDGSHVIDLKSPLPGPHFAVNLLLGNRIGFDFPLQTTPKSVVDRLGRGSFRSHAATQVLATRWDLRQEENGFPCNRQFYLTEGEEQIFHSADPEDPNITAGTCRHARNHTEISYRTFCGLVIKRTLFLLPQNPGLPLATEIQRIEITNAGHGSGPRSRNLRLVFTGMFGPSKPGALQEDVLYSNIIMQGGILKNDDGGILALSPDYWPAQDRDDRRFHTMMIRDAGGTRLPREFSVDYTGFVGRGTLERPAGIFRLPCRLTRKGPGFFALAGELSIAPGETAIIDNFTGLVSRRGNAGYTTESLAEEVARLTEQYGTAGSVAEALERVKSFQRDYASFLTIDNGERDFSAYVSENLPFQVLYQTFVSRSFAQTQKGYREIGFREIQDIFASLYYLHARGNSALTRQLILDWASQVYRFGYANHNFFWTGKEGGKWSDDALWLHQAVARYVNLTGDVSILDAGAPLADEPFSGKGRETRSLFETLKAALRYSAEISVGPHGLPLLDLADWNDCLKLDKNFHSGPEKEKIWRETGSYTSHGTESVMNGFLAVTAARELAGLARQKGDEGTRNWCEGVADTLSDRLKKHAWIGKNYTRLLFNQYPGFTHAGAAGDGLDTDSSGGTFFLNSFSWSVLSGVADESQVADMLGEIRKKLKTPFGLKLVSPMDLGRVVPTAATSEYFPGDRENGAVFKHAAMMAVAALFDAAKTVSDPGLAAELAAEAWEMIDLACPVRSMTDPFVLAGNPRFCTQYNNSDTGENIGPLLSGTATWMILSLMKGYGIEFTAGGLKIDPVLKPADRSIKLTLKTGGREIRITVTKPEGFCRAAGGHLKLTVNGKPAGGNVVSLAGTEKVLEITGDLTR